MSVQSETGPRVRHDAAELAVRDPKLRGVALVHELRRPRRREFARDGGTWRLTLPRPEADRLEYLLEVTYRNGRKALLPDPTNPLAAPGPFGSKSVIEFPGYEAPAWVDDEEAAPGALRELPLESVRLRETVPALLWSAADTDPERPLPLLIVHDGPEYAEFSSLVRLLDHLVDFGEVPELRAALVPPPGDRNESYSASARYANALAADLVPGILREAPSNRPPVLARREPRRARRAARALPQPGARRRACSSSRAASSGGGSTAASRGFPRFARITRFVGQVHGRRGFAPRIPATITCGIVEENFDNNRALAGALKRRGWDVDAAWHRDAHNWTSWRDSLHPHLAELLLRAWT